jgi:hypothetical protein
MRALELLLRARPALVGVLHLAPLPGAPRYGGSLDAVLARVREDARALIEGGVDGLVLENYGDAPFFAGPVPPETVAALALALREVRVLAGTRPLGVNVLRNDARAALALCATAGAEFLRVNVHTGVMVSDQGLLEGRAAETLRERARLAPHAALFADVHVKHATPLGRETLEEAALDARERGLADALILTGRATGAAPEARALERVRARVGATPLFVGSGLDVSNTRALLAVADGALVGSALRAGGRAGAPVELERVARLRAELDALRRAQ